MSIFTEARVATNDISCNIFTGINSEFYVVPYNVGNIDPTLYQLNFLATTATSATVQAIGVDAPVQAGMTLTNSLGDFFTFDDDFIVTTTGTPTLFGTRSASFALEAVSYYEKFEALQIVSIDYDGNDTTLTRNFVGNLKTEHFRKNYSLSSNVSLLASRTDDVTWKYLHKAWKEGQFLKLFTSRAKDGRTVTGDAIITNFKDSLSLGDISRLSFQLLWNDYQDFGPFASIQTSEQTSLNAQRALFALPQVS